MSSTPTRAIAVPDPVWDAAVLESRLADPGLKVIDVRVGEDYAMGHITGALHFSVYGLNTYDTDAAPL